MVRTVEKKVVQPAKKQVASSGDTQKSCQTNLGSGQKQPIGHG